MSLSHYYYVRSGWVLVDNGPLKFVGVNGYSWSQSGRSDARSAYFLYFVSSGVYPLGNNGRYIAFSVRRVGRGELEKCEKIVYNEI